MSEIAILEDNVSFGDGLAELISEQGYDVTLLRNRAAAETLLEVRPPACLIADVHVEGSFGTDGLDLLRQIRHRNQAVDVIVMSGLGIPKIREEALALGALEFLAKPFPLDRVLELLPPRCRTNGRLAHFPTFANLLAPGAIQLLVHPIYRHDRGAWHLYGFEALARGPSRTLLEPPLALFRFAQASGRLIELDEHCFASAMDCSRRIGRSETMAINLHPASLQQPGIGERLLGGWLESDLANRSWILEIVEHGECRDTPIARANLHHFRMAGFRIAIDDIGEGASTLATIDWMRPDLIKLGQPLTAGVVRDRQRRAIVAGILDLADRLDIEVVVEGVETEADCGALVGLGARLAQGFLFSRPVAAALAWHVPRIIEFGADLFFDAARPTYNWDRRPRSAATSIPQGGVS